MFKKFSKKTDNELIQLSLKHNSRAFAELMQRYRLKVVGLIRRYVWDHHEIADVTQEVFLRVYNNLARFREDSLFSTWLYSITMNYLKDLKLMHKKNRFTFGLHTEYLGYLTNEIVLKDEASPERIMACEQVKQTINRLVCQLKEEIKMAFVLREMEGLSYEVIADIQDCPIGTVRSRIYRARESLNLALGESTFENESAFKLSKPKK